jgi:hypothetical protein
MKFRAVLAASLKLILTGVVIVSMIIAGPAWGEFLQKQFIICKDQGRDVLCDPVVVQKNDFVIRLFKQKGEIAYSDFPKFLAIFKRLNPEVQDLDLIYPGQRVMVPLKLVEPGTLEGQATGTVSIPLITITNIPAQLHQNSMGYVVLQGDSVSSLISRTFGRHSDRSYKEALEIFKYLNPQIKDLNRIKTGQTIQIPTRKVMDASWYPELFDRSGKLVVQEKPKAAEVKPPVKEPVMEFQPVPVVPAAREARMKITASAPKATPISPEPVMTIKPKFRAFVPKSVIVRAPKPVIVPVPVPVPAAPPKPVASAAPAVAMTAAEKVPAEKSKAQKAITPPPVEVRKPLPSIFKKAAGIFNASLLDTGEYFFPRQGSSDLRVDLSATPVMEFPSGFRLLFAKQKALSAPDQKVITAFWKNASIVTLSYDAPVRELLSAICRTIDPMGCENHIAINDNGMAVSIRGDFIFDAIGSRGKTCVTLIDRDSQQMPDAIQRYLQEKQIFISEWIDSESFFGQVTSQGGKTMTTPLPVLRLPFDAAHPAGFVKDFVTALGLRYQEKVEISFPYAGFQVKAYANLLSAAPGREVLVDFGDLQGDAIKSIEATGFQVLQIKPQQDAASIVSALLYQLPAQQQENPVFWTAEREQSHNTSLQIPGRLISLTTDHGQRGLLLTDLALNENILAFLAEAGIQVGRISNPY